MVMPEFGPQDLVQLFREAKTRRVKTVLDVVIGAGVPAPLDQIEPALHYTDAFLPNDDEARALTGRTDPSDQAEVLSRLNPDCVVVITMGQRGALARHRDQVIRVGAYQVDCVDESGAGDAFDAGFVTGLLEEWSLESTLRFASAMGASCTRALGCTEGVFHLHEAEVFVAQNPLDIKFIPQ